jgi:hypothetical protein
MSGVIDRVLKHEELCVALDLLFGKNEAMGGRLPGKSFALLADEEVGSFGELAALQAAAFVLNFAELMEGPLELA